MNIDKLNTLLSQRKHGEPVFKLEDFYELDLLGGELRVVLSRLEGPNVTHLWIQAWGQGEFPIVSKHVEYKSRRLFNDNELIGESLVDLMNHWNLELWDYESSCSEISNWGSEAFPCHTSNDYHICRVTEVLKEHLEGEKENIDKIRRGMEELESLIDKPRRSTT